MLTFQTRRASTDASQEPVFFAGELDPPQPMIMGFIDAMRALGHAVESICRVLREQPCLIAARTYRAWKQTGRDSTRVAARTITDAHVVDAVRATAWTTDHRGVRKLTLEGLYGHRKMTARLRRTTMPGAPAGSVDRAMHTLELVGVRRDKGVRTTIPAKDGVRAGDLLDRDFTAAAPNRIWVTDFLRADLVTGVGLRRVHRRCDLPADRGLARLDV